MANTELNTEAKILEAANSIFLQFGYHGTTLQQIATRAAVNTAAIHYYFRSKENIYSIVLLNNLSQLLDVLNHHEFYSVHKSNTTYTPDATQNIKAERIAWFLLNEIRTHNQFLIEMIVANDKISNLITSIFSYPENIEILQQLITSQFSKIIKLDLPGKSDPVERALKLNINN
ncbi:MAG: TetR family transcriptional regulator [Prolixibacteraceae bacterium]|nr:TetR family transcriptional regulator [Prolixibacteraceae bacterium]